MSLFRRRRTPPTEGAAQRVRAEIGLERAKAQTPMFQRLTKEIRDLRERNHLGESFQEAFRRGSP